MFGTKIRMGIHLGKQVAVAAQEPRGEYSCSQVFVKTLGNGGVREVRFIEELAGCASVLRQ